MKPFTPEQKNWLKDAREICAADLYTITLKDGTVFRFTSRDTPVTYNGHVYHSRDMHIRRGSLSTAAGLQVQQLDLTVHTTAQPVAFDFKPIRNVYVPPPPDPENFDVAAVPGVFGWYDAGDQIYSTTVAPGQVRLRNKLVPFAPGGSDDMRRTDYLAISDTRFLTDVDGRRGLAAGTDEGPIELEYTSDAKYPSYPAYLFNGSTIPAFVGGRDRRVDETKTLYVFVVADQSVTGPLLSGMDIADPDYVAYQQANTIRVNTGQIAGPAEPIERRQVYSVSGRSRAAGSTQYQTEMSFDLGKSNLVRFTRDFALNPDGLASFTGPRIVSYGHTVPAVFTGGTNVPREARTDGIRDDARTDRVVVPGGSTYTENDSPAGKFAALAYSYHYMGAAYKGRAGLDAPLKGRIYEVILMNRIPEQSDISAITAYLAMKWDAPLETP